MAHFFLTVLHFVYTVSEASASNVPSSSQPSNSQSVSLNINKDHLNADSCLANSLTTKDDGSINRVESSSQEQELPLPDENAEQGSASNNDVDANLGAELSNPADKIYLESITSNDFGQETMQTEDEILESLN